MIRINLLPVRAARKKERGRMQLGILALVLLAAGVGNWIWYGAAKDDLESVQAEVRQTRAKIAELDKIIGEVNDIQKRKEELERKLEVITKLRKQKTGPVKMLDSMATIIPQEVWVDRFVEKDGTFTLDGEALSHEDLAGFLTALKQSKYFQNVALKTAKLGKAKVANREVVQFTLTGKADYAA